MKDRGEDLVDEISNEDVHGLGDAMKRIKELEAKFKVIQSQLREERKQRQEIILKFEERQKLFEKEMEKLFDEKLRLSSFASDEKLITIFSRMPPFIAGKFYKAMNISHNDRRVESTQRLIEYLDSTMDNAKMMENATIIIASIIYGVDCFLAFYPPAPTIISKIAFSQKATTYFTLVDFFILSRLKDKTPFQTEKNNYITYFQLSWIAAIACTIYFFFVVLYRVFSHSKEPA